MNSKSSFICILVVCTILPFTSLSRNSMAQSTSNSDTTSLSPHNPLILQSDEELQSVASQEGWGGDGTQENPILIENYEFSTGEENPLEADQIKQSLISMSQDLSGFSSYSLILNDISLFVDIKNNEFIYSVAINGSDNVDIINNKWINPDYPANLFINSKLGLKSNPIEIQRNTFSGSNLKCGNGSETQFDFTPRVFIIGSGLEIHGNEFDLDNGCLPIQDIAINVYRFIFTELNFTNIYNNVFHACDVAIHLMDGNTNIYDNDFEIGDFGIITIRGGKINHNNFEFSDLGAQGSQNYIGDGTIIDDFGYNVIHEGKTIAFSPAVDNNYYKHWTEPDKDSDGIVDEPYFLGNWQSSSDATVTPIYDYHPSTKPFPLDDSSDDQRKGLIILGVSAFMALIGLSGSFVYFRYIKEKPLFDGDLTPTHRKFIEELFQSQTVLYYTLIGQHRIQDPNIESNVKQAVPVDLWSFKHIFHPTKLAILKLLYENISFTSTDLKSILKLSWNDFYCHAYSLQKKGLITIEEEFAYGNKKQTLQLTLDGAQEYKQLTELLHIFLDNSVDYQAYIDEAQKRMVSIDRGLYPDK